MPFLPPPRVVSRNVPIAINQHKIGYTVAAYIAARLVSSINTMGQERGCSSRYFFTVFLDSPTSTAQHDQSFILNSCASWSTNGASPTQ